MTEEQQVVHELHNTWFEAKGTCGLAIGYIEFFLDGKLGDVTDEQREALQVIRRNTYRIYECTQHAAEFAGIFLSSIEKEPLPLQPVFLAEVVEQSVRSLSVYSRTQSVDVRIPANLPPVQAHPYSLCRGIENILDPFLYEGGHKFSVSAHLASEKLVNIEINTSHKYLAGGRLSVAAHIIQRHGSELKCNYSNSAAKFQFALRSATEIPA